MMFIVYLILGVIGFAILLVLFFASQKPNEFKVERAIVINARPEKVFPQINDLHNWQEWTVWSKMDPACKINYHGPLTGVDSAYDWNGNNKVGAGKLTIVESHPCETVALKLEFFRPFKCVNSVSFHLLPQGDQTSVTWNMKGENEFMAKVMCLFMDMDKLVGSDFEKGLANMKSRVEQVA